MIQPSLLFRGSAADPVQSIHRDDALGVTSSCASDSARQVSPKNLLPSLNHEVGIKTEVAALEAHIVALEGDHIPANLEGA